MWHWSVSALAAGASLVLSSGSPSRPHGHLSLPRVLSALRVTHFGTSAAYLAALRPAAPAPPATPALDLSRLEAVYSTAAPLAPSTSRFVYEGLPRGRRPGLHHRRHRHHLALRRALPPAARPRRRGPEARRALGRSWGSRLREAVPLSAAGLLRPGWGREVSLCVVFLLSFFLSSTLLPSSNPLFYILPPAPFLIPQSVSTISPRAPSSVRATPHYTTPHH